MSRLRKITRILTEFTQIHKPFFCALIKTFTWINLKTFIVFFFFTSNLFTAKNSPDYVINIVSTHLQKLLKKHCSHFYTATLAMVFYMLKEQVSDER